MRKNLNKFHKTEKKKIILIGCGGHAKVCADVILNSKKYKIADFTSRKSRQRRQNRKSNHFRHKILIYSDSMLKSNFPC